MTTLAPNKSSEPKRSSSSGRGSTWGLLLTLLESILELLVDTANVGAESLEEASAGREDADD